MNKRIYYSLLVVVGFYSGIIMSRGASTGGYRQANYKRYQNIKVDCLSTIQAVAPVVKLIIKNSTLFQNNLSVELRAQLIKQLEEIDTFVGQLATLQKDEQNFIAPCSEVQHLLSAIWELVLAGGEAHTHVIQLIPQAHAILKRVVNQYFGISGLARIQPFPHQGEQQGVTNVPSDQSDVPQEGTPKYVVEEVD